MKKILSILLILLLFTSCSNNQKKESKVDDKVIDTRVTLKSDNGDILNSKYNEIINETSIYNVSKDLDCIKYNTTINNGKEISEVLNEYSNLNFEEVTIK